MGRRPCELEGCYTGAVRCQHEGCNKGAVTGGTPHCTAHGGCLRCNFCPAPVEHGGSGTSCLQCTWFRAAMGPLLDPLPPWAYTAARATLASSTRWQLHVP
jgi:hypothetical protein